MELMDYGTSFHCFPEIMDQQIQEPTAEFNLSWVSRRHMRPAGVTGGLHFLHSACRRAVSPAVVSAVQGT